MPRIGDTPAIPARGTHRAVSYTHLLVLVFAAIAAVSFASCGNKAAEAAKAEADSIRIADSIAAVEAAAAEAAAAMDTVTVDSVTVTETVVAE